jgi:hypothetical protein
MDSSQNTPQVGLKPPKIRDHAAQLEADIKALQEYRDNYRGKARVPKWEMIKSFMESVMAYVQKTENQPTHTELAADVNATAKAQEEIRKEVTQIKNLLAAPTSKATTLTYAQAFKNPYMLKPALQSRPTSGLREILVKLKDIDPNGEARTATAETIKERINGMLEKSTMKDEENTRVMAVKRHPSEDITLRALASLAGSTW